jgi:hypothetical protein
VSICNLPFEVLVLIAAHVNTQAYNPAPFVCKQFYNSFINLPVNSEFKYWRLSIPSNQVNSFVRACMWTELNKKDPDFVHFPKDLMRAIIHHYTELRVGTWNISPDETVRDWGKMATCMIEAYVSSRSQLLQVGLARLNGEQHAANEQDYNEVGVSRLYADVGPTRSGSTGESDSEAENLDYDDESGNDEF